MAEAGIFADGDVIRFKTRAFQQTKRKTADLDGTAKGGFEALSQRPMQPAAFEQDRKAVVKKKKRGDTNQKKPEPMSRPPRGRSGRRRR